MGESALGMKKLDRINRILELLETESNISVAKLALSLGISESSIRRDLSYILSLNKYSNLRRIHGGILLDNDHKTDELMFDIKNGINRELKMDIARKAAECITDNDSILLDSGTTAFCLATLLGKKNGLHVITVDLKIGEELGKYPNLESYIVGGVIRPGYYSIGGTGAIDNLKQFSCNKVFMTVDAIDVEYGITNASAFEVGVKRELLKCGKHIYVIADITKFNRSTLHRVTAITSVHTIITNKGLEAGTQELIRSKGIELILV